MTRRTTHLSLHRAWMYASHACSILPSPPPIHLVCLGHAVADRSIDLDESIEKWISDVTKLGKGGGKLNVSKVYYDRLGGNAPNVAMAAGTLFSRDRAPYDVTLVVRSGDMVERLVHRTIRKFAEQGRVGFTAHIEGKGAADRLNTILEFSGGKNVILSFEGDYDTVHWSFSHLSHLKGIKEVLCSATDMITTKLYPLTVELVRARKTGTILHEGKMMPLPLSAKLYVDTSYNRARCAEDKGEKAAAFIDALRAKGQCGTNRDIVITVNDSEMCALAEVLSSQEKGKHNSKWEEGYDAALFVSSTLAVPVVLHNTEYVCAFLPTSDHAPAQVIPHVVPIFDIKPVLVTGAGDTFNAGLIVFEAIRREATRTIKRFGMTIEHSLTLALAMTSYRLVRKEAVWPTFDELLTSMNEIPLLPIPERIVRKLPPTEKRKIARIWREIKK